MSALVNVNLCFCWRSAATACSLFCTCQILFLLQVVSTARILRLSLTAYSSASCFKLYYENNIIYNTKLCFTRSYGLYNLLSIAILQLTIVLTVSRCRRLVLPCAWIWLLEHLHNTNLPWLATMVRMMQSRWASEYNLFFRKLKGSVRV